MKSIKQQFIDLKEGRMSQQNFMRNLRMTLPQYVTNVTSYNDAVKILRNKGILTETLSEKNLDVDPKELKKGIEVEKEHTNDPVKAEEIALDHLKEDPKYYSKLDKAGLEEDMDAMDATASAAEKLAKQMGDYDSAVVALQNEMGLSRQQAESIASQVFPEDDGEVEDMIRKYKEEESGKYTKFEDEPGTLSEAKSKWENTSGKSMYAQFKEIDNLNGQEVLIGIDFEIEKNPKLSKIEAAKLVLKNLKKNPIYYTATLMAGKEMTEIPTIGKLKPGSDKMRELKGEDSLVDKDNGMKPVKDVEKVKASANKAKKETNKADGTISLMSLVAKASRGVEKMNATGEKMKVVKEGLDEVTIKRGPSDTKSKLIDIVKGFIESNPTLKMYQDDIALVDQGSEEEVILQFDNNAIPDEVKVALEKQYNVKEEEIPVGETTVKIHYVLTPKFKLPEPTMIGKVITREDLMEMIREELSEYFDGRDNLTDVTGENK